MSERDSLVLWAVVDDLGGPLLFAGIAAYEAWPGATTSGDAETLLDGSPARTLVWRAIAQGDELDATCWVDDQKHEILFLQCRGTDRDEGVARIRGGEEVAVGEIVLDAGFVVAAASVPASRVKTLPSKLMKQRVGGRPLSQLSMKRTDDDVGSCFPIRAGVWAVARVDGGPGCRGLWIRRARDA